MTHLLLAESIRENERAVSRRGQKKGDRPAAPIGTHSDMELLTIPAAAHRLGIGRKQLRRAVAEGELDTYQIGAWPRVRWADVRNWAGSKRVRPTSHARRRVAEILACETRSAS